jgi:hypothetical protein
MATKLRAPLSTHVAPTKGSPSAKTIAPGPTFEEVFVRNDVVSLCLLLNRRARTMRVIDFRAGASPAKKLFVQSIARRERIEKVVVLVERDECATWARLGFVREGNIPGFYKRSDAFIMGCVVPALDGSSTAARTAPATPKSRLTESGVFTVGHHSVFQSEADEPDLDDDAPTSVANAQAEKIVTQARRLAKDLAQAPLPSVKLAPLANVDVQKRVAVATKEGRALTGFESFGRDVTRDDMIVSTKGLSDLVIGAEIQRCYGNAFVEVLTAPRDDKERNFLVAALHAACERLLTNEIVCAFAISPVDDVRMATAFIAAGFRRTGVLRQHLRLKNDRVDAILWSRKLATPGSEEE